MLRTKREKRMEEKEEKENETGKERERDKEREEMAWKRNEGLKVVLTRRKKWKWKC